MNIKTVGVIGAGVMGLGVAQNLAQVGLKVVLIDTTQAVLDKAQSELKNNLRFAHMLNKSAVTPMDPAQALDRIQLTTAYSALECVDFVIENVTEKWPVKQDVYPLMEQYAPKNCVFAANTSAIPITQIAALTKRPSQVIGIHFMNPVPMKKTVELIKGFHTSPDTIAVTTELLAAMGKDFVLVNDSPGFVSNRVLMLTINEAIHLVHENVSCVEDIDRVFTECFGHKMGPLATADLIGLDTILYSIEVLYESFSDSKYRPSTLLKKMVAAGLHGRKSGQGFYNYPT
jgi:3-hydroxybutyryl-CoA dehydrogenase